MSSSNRNKTQRLVLLAISLLGVVVPLGMMSCSSLEEETEPDYSYGPYSTANWYIDISSSGGQFNDDPPWSYLFTVRVHDDQGNGYPDIPISVECNFGTISPTSGYTDEDGCFDFTYTTSYFMGTAIITIQVMGQEFEFTIPPP